MAIGSHCGAWAASTRVFADPDGGAVVVDWKTGEPPAWLGGRPAGRYPSSVSTG